MIFSWNLCCFYACVGGITAYYCLFQLGPGQNSGGDQGGETPLGYWIPAVLQQQKQPKIPL